MKTFSFSAALWTVSAMEFPGSLPVKQQTSGNPFAQSLAGVVREFCGEGHQVEAAAAKKWPPCNYCVNRKLVLYSSIHLVEPGPMRHAAKEESGDALDASDTTSDARRERAEIFLFPFTCNPLKNPI